ncbi:class I glutamine amidotransferase-like protein, partial [Amylostereum chailletii]
LALLVCDTPIPAVIATHGDYERIFKTFFLKSLPDGLDAFNMDAFDVRGKKEYPAEDRLDDYDGIVITGSAASAYEDVEWINKLVAWVARIATSKPQIKIIAICFGHQIVAHALGGTCIPNDGKWEVGITDIALTDVGQRIFKTGTFNIQQMHRDHVPSVPPSFYLLGSTPVSLNQGMVRFVDSASSPDLSQPLPPIHILTLQGHPEFTKELVNELVDARSASGILDQATAQQARDRTGWRNDGPSVMGRALWEVLRA